MTQDAASDAGIRVGERIRAARLAANLSVRELARQIGVASSHVSQVERGLASFSVAALYKVVSLLGISMDSLFVDAPLLEDERSAEPEVESVPATFGPLDESGVVLRADTRYVIPLSSGKRWERLTPATEAGVEFIEVVYAPNTGMPAQVEFVRHTGREFGVIVQGSLTVEVGFDRTVLRVGDSIAFDSHRPHRFWNETPHEVRAVWFILDDQQVGDTPSTRDAAAHGGATPSHGR